MSLGRMDHVAIEVPDVDPHIARLTATGAMRLLRRGQTGTGKRIAMLGDGTGGKIELIENPDLTEPRFAHVAFRCERVEDAQADLVEQAWQVKRGPHELAAAQARTALLTDGGGFDLQVIAYRPTSPDIVEWSAADDGGPEETSGRQNASDPESR